MTAHKPLSPLSFLYLLEDGELSGGNRIVVAQADALIARGHRVRIATKGEPVRWRPNHAEWVEVADYSEVDAASADCVIATFWTTLAPALALGGSRAFHLCQGYEGSISYYEAILPQIEEAYRLPIPKLIVARSLDPLCRRFTPEVIYIGQIVDEPFFRSEVPPPSVPLRLLVTGQYEVDLRGIVEAYEAIRIARRRGAEFDLIRISSWQTRPDEPTDLAKEIHIGVPTETMTQLMHSCDMAMALNWSAEGFGLPAAEALASAIPVVLSTAASYLSFDPVHDYALFVPERDPNAAADALLRLTSDADLRSALSTRGREVAQQFHAGNVARRIEEAVLRYGR